VSTHEQCCVFLVRIAPSHTQRRHRHWSSVVHGCLLSATELFLSPLPVSETNCHAKSRLHRTHRVFCTRLKTHFFQPLLFRLFVAPAVKWRASLSDTLIDLRYLLASHRSVRSDTFRVRCKRTKWCAMEVRLTDRRLDKKITGSEPTWHLDNREQSRVGDQPQPSDQLTLTTSSPRVYLIVLVAVSQR